MLHSPIGNAKPPASAGSQTLSFDANQKSRSIRALPEGAKSERFTLGRAPAAKDSAQQSCGTVNRHGQGESAKCRRRASARRFIKTV